MNSHKRIFMIIALAALLFAAIAVVPGSHRLLASAGDAPAPSVVILECGTAALEVISASSSDPSVPLPITNSSCSSALNGLFAQGFRRQDFGTVQNPFVFPDHVPEPVFIFVLSSKRDQ